MRSSQTDNQQKTVQQLLDEEMVAEAELQEINTNI
jgi:hypothetical protein